MECDVRMFWPTGLALALATTAVLLFPDSPARRMSNLDLAGGGFRDTFLVFSRSQTDRCRVVDRRDATMRRYDSRRPGRNRDCLRLPGRNGDAQAHTWLVRSKRKGEGTAFFVPVHDVRDWSYPFLYGFVRDRRGENDLPGVEWTQLFVNRLYQGLYLRVALPFDLRRKDGGSGILRELLTIQDGRLSAVDTRFDEAGHLYAGRLEVGVSPELIPPPPELAWLTRRCPTAGITFLLSNLAPYDLSLLPLPVSLPDLYALKEGRPPRVFEDERHLQWTRAPWRPNAVDHLPFTDIEASELHSSFEAYAVSFRRALRADAALHRSFSHLRQLLPTRQTAIADLQLRLPEL